MFTFPFDFPCKIQWIYMFYFEEQILSDYNDFLVLIIKPKVCYILSLREQFDLKFLHLYYLFLCFLVFSTRFKFPFFFFNTDVNFFCFFNFNIIMIRSLFPLNFFYISFFSNYLKLFLLLLK